jgi:hypothetical protein
MNKRDELYEDGYVWDRNENLLAEPYLFKSESNLIIFNIIEREMEQLNNFCMICLDAVDNKVGRLGTDAEDYKSGKKKIFDTQDSSLDLSDEVADGIESYVLPAWKDIQGFSVRAMCFIMVAVFTEKTLLDLCKFVLGETAQKSRDDKRSDIKFYLDSLKEVKKFEIPKNVEDLMSICKKIRNKFVHGEWNEVKELMSGIYIRESFTTVTNLLAVIESAFISKSAIT